MRARLDWPVSIHIEEESFERSTFDIGPDGAFVRGLSLLELYEVFDMTVIGPDRPIKTKARVVWSRNEAVAGVEKDMPRGMGVEFIKISDEDWNFVSSFISDLEFAMYLESGTTNEVEDSLIHQHLIEEQKEEYINNAAQKSPKDAPGATSICPGLLTKTMFSVGTATKGMSSPSVMIRKIPKPSLVLIQRTNFFG